MKYYSISLYYFDWQVLQILWSDSWGPISLCYRQVTAFGCCWQVRNFKPQNGCPAVSKAKFPHPNLAKLKAFSTGSLLFVWWLCKWPFATWCFFANNVVETPNMSIMGPKTHMQWKDGLNGTFDTHQVNGLTGCDICEIHIQVNGQNGCDIWFASSEWMH